MGYGRFRHVAIANAKPAPADEQLTAIERLFGAALPATFREFLRVANGGHIPYSIDVPTGPGQTEPISFCGVFSAEEGTSCEETFLGEIRSARDYAKIPSGVLPFARDGGGSIVYLDLTRNGKGRVVAFVEGLPGWVGRRTESAFIELAPSFDAYLDKLYIERECLLADLEQAKEPQELESIEELLEIGFPNWQEVNEIRTAMEAARQRLAR